MKSTTRNRPARRAAVPADLAATVTRMKAAAADQNPDVAAEGRKAGNRWARDMATPRQLLRLARRAEDAGPGYQWDATDIVAAVTNERREDVEFGACGREFFDRLGSYREDEWTTPEYCVAFVGAALAVWERVSPHI